jgi:SPP1 gp7 family putative phage head morphogenesis protein
MAKEDNPYDVPPPPQTNAAPVDTAIRHQVYLERVSTHIAGEVQAGVILIGPEMVNLLGQLSDDLSSLSPKTFGSVLAEAKAANTQLMLDAVANLAPQLADIAQYETEFTGRALGGITRGVRIRSLKAGQAYKAALEQPIPATGEMLDGFIKDWTKKEAASVGQVISKGYTQGWTNDQILQAVRGTRKANYADGIVARVGRNADAVVRTSVQHVANTARRETWAKNSDIVKWEIVIATLDSRTTQQCRSLDHKRFPLGEAPKFPLHIRCRTTTAGDVDDKYAFLDEGATRSAEFGPVDQDMTYYQWLGKQPQAFQDDAIGPTRAKLFRDGGLSADEFARLNLGRNFEPMTLDEMRKKEPNAFKRAGL